VSERVTFDTDQLDRDMRRLTDGIRAGAQSAARRQANETAGRISSRVPRRTGRLAGTVGVEGDGDAYAVTYGGGLPYADYIEGRSGAVADGIEGSDTTFEAAMRSLADRETRAL
jgi:Bacteriophage HK97-gp10, putative tail-component